MYIDNNKLKFCHFEMTSKNKSFVFRFQNYKL